MLHLLGTMDLYLLLVHFRILLKTREPVYQPEPEISLTNNHSALP